MDPNDLPPSPAAQPPGPDPTPDRPADPVDSDPAPTADRSAEPAAADQPAGSPTGDGAAAVPVPVPPVPPADDPAAVGSAVPPAPPVAWTPPVEAEPTTTPADDSGAVASTEESAPAVAWTPTAESAPATTADPAPAAGQPAAVPPAPPAAEPVPAAPPVAEPVSAAPPAAEPAAVPVPAAPPAAEPASSVPVSSVPVAAQSPAEPVSRDPGTGDPGTGEPGTGDPGTGPRATAAGGAGATAAAPADGDGDGDGRRVGRLVRNGALAVLALALVVGTVLLARQLQTERAAERARTEALPAARDAARVLFSYDHTKLDADFARGLAVTTGKFRKEYTRTTKEVVRDVALQYDAVVKAEVSEAGVIRASPDEVVVLVFLNQSTTSTRVEGQKIDQSRVRMRLVERDGDWRVAEVTAL